MSEHHCFSLTMAQDDGPFNLPVQGAGGEGTGAPGGAGGAGGRPAGDPFGSSFFLILLVVLGAMILFSIMGQRRDRKKREVMLSAVKKHDKVQTIGGIIGSIVDVKSDEVVIKVDENSNTRLTIARSAIQQVRSTTGGTEPAAPMEKS